MSFVEPVTVQFQTALSESTLVVNTLLEPATTKYQVKYYAVAFAPMSISNVLESPVTAPNIFKLSALF